MSTMNVVRTINDSRPNQIAATSRKNVSISSSVVLTSYWMAISLFVAVL